MFSWKFPVVLEVPVAAFSPVRNCVEPYQGFSQKDVENFFPPVKFCGGASWCFQKFRTTKNFVKLRFPDFSSHNVCLTVPKIFVKIFFGFYEYLPALGTDCTRVLQTILRGKAKRTRMRKLVVILEKLIMLMLSKNEVSTKFRI